MHSNFFYFFVRFSFIPLHSLGIKKAPGSQAPASESLKVLAHHTLLFGVVKNFFLFSQSAQSAFRVGLSAKRVFASALR
jgi:hypothetical protein